MPKLSQHPEHTLGSCSLSTAGLVTPTFPAALEQKHGSSVAPTRFTSARPSVGKCTPAFYSNLAHTETRSSIIITLSIVGPDLAVSKDNFPTGSLTISITSTTDFNDQTSILDHSNPQTGLHRNQNNNAHVSIRYSVSQSMISGGGVLGLAGHLGCQPLHRGISSRRSS